MRVKTDGAGIHSHLHRVDRDDTVIEGNLEDLPEEHHFPNPLVGPQRPVLQEVYDRPFHIDAGLLLQARLGLAVAIKEGVQCLRRAGRARPPPRWIPPTPLTGARQSSAR
jgi:hypothetical protein